MMRLVPLGSLVLTLVALAGVQAQPKPVRRRAPPRPAAKKPDEEKKEVEKPKKPDRWFAVHAGWVHTVSDGGVLRNVTILSKNGKIHQIGEELTLPEKTEVLDARTRHVYPGLVAYDSQGMVGSADSTDVFGLQLVLGLSAGLTTVCQSGLILKLTYGTLEGHLVGPKSPGVRIDYRSAQSRRKVRQTFEKVREWIREEREAKNAKARGDEVEPPKPLKGMLAQYLQLARGEAYAEVRANDEQELTDLANLGLRYGFRATVEGGLEAWKVAPLLGRAGFRVVVVPRSKGSRWYRPAETDPEPKWSIENAAILHKHGVPVIVMPGSKGIGLWGVAGQDMLTLTLEAAFAVRGGLPEEEALKAITLGPAQFLGVDDRVGSIEVGKDMDLAITSGDLLHYQTLVEWTVVNGRIAYDKQKDSLLRHIRPRDLETNLKVPRLWPREKGTREPEMPEQER